MRMISGVSGAVVVFLAVSLLAAAPAASQARDEEGVAGLTLREAVEKALAGNHELRAMEARAAAAYEGIGESRSNLLPRVTFEERYMRTDVPAYVFSSKINQGRFLPEDLAGAPDTFNHPATLNDFETSITAEQPLFAPRAMTGTRMAETGARRAALFRDRARQETAFHVFRAYEGLRVAKAMKTAAEAALAEAEEHLRLARERRDAGVGLDSDVLLLEAAAGKARSDLISAKNGVALAARRLGLLLGIDGPADIDGEGPIPDLPSDVDDGLVSSRPDILAASAHVREAELGLNMATAGLFPTVGVFAAGQWNDSGQPFGHDGESFRAGAVLRWELFSGFGDQARRARAARELDAAREAEEGRIKAARFELQEARLRLGEASAMVDVARRSADAAREGLRLVRLRYENGLAPVVALLGAQAALDGARAHATQSEAGYRVALGTLHHRAGSLLAHIVGGE